MFFVALFLAWMGAVLLRWQGVQSAEVPVTVLLMLAWLAIFSLACVGVGWGVWRAGGGRLLGLTDWLVSAGLGCAGLVTAGLVLSLFGWFHPVPLGAVMAAAAAVGGWVVWRHRGTVVPARINGRALPLAVLVGLVGVYTLLVTGSASPFYDQFHYHLGFPYQWLRAGSIEVFPRHAYSFFPAAMGILYAYSLQLLGAWSAQAIHWWMGAVTVLAAALLARQVGGPGSAWVAGAILATTPSVMQAATWAAADLGAAAFAALAWLLILRTWRAPQVPLHRGVWVAAGALAGLAAAAKLLALTTVALPLCAVSLVAQPRRAWRAAGRLVLLGLGFSLTFGPWAVRNLLATGDPLHPFGSAYLARLSQLQEDSEQAVARGIVGGEAAVARPPTLVTLGTFAPLGEAGAIGPLYLALLPLAAWSVHRDRRRGAALLALAAALAVAGWAVGPPRGRYLLPVLPLLAALGAAGWRHAVAAVPCGARKALNVLLIAALGWSATAGATAVDMRRLASTLGVADGEELLRQYVTYWPAIRPVNAQLPEDATLLLVGESRPFLLDRDLVVEDPFQTPWLVELAEAGREPAEIAAALRQRGVTHVLVNYQEGRRIAAMNKRGTFLQPRNEEAARHLAAFLAGCLEPVISAPPVEVFVLRECAP